MESWPEEGKVMERWPEEGSVIRCSYQRILRYQYFHYPTLFMNDGVKGYSASEGSLVYHFLSLHVAKDAEMFTLAHTLGLWLLKPYTGVCIPCTT